MLFFSPKAYLGLAVDKDGTVVRVQQALDRFGKAPVPKPGGRRVTLRIVNNKQDVLVYSRDAAGRWVTVPPALEISGAEHNVLSDWHCVRRPCSHAEPVKPVSTHLRTGRSNENNNGTYPRPADTASHAMACQEFQALEKRGTMTSNAWN